MANNDPLTGVSTRKTPQTQSIPGRTDQVQNNAGGFGFKVDQWTHLRRFMILGTEGGTYYVNERKLTKDAAKSVIACVKDDGLRTVREIVEVSTEGLAAKVNPTIFALAVAAGVGDDKTRAAALDALPDVCRTGTHLFQFATYVEQFRGWGRGLRRAIGAWYTERPVSQMHADALRDEGVENVRSPLDLQLVKYRQREGWSHRDLLRLSHPVTADPQRNAMFKYVVDRDEVDVRTLEVTELIELSERVLTMTDTKAIAKLAGEHNLPWEVLPSESLKAPEVWEAILPTMGLTALIRNLGRMSSIGLLTEFSDAQKVVVERLGNEKAIHRARVHPFSILLAASTYGAGRGVKGSMTWKALPKVTSALDAAFYKAFKNVEPSGKNTLIGLDVSGSMGTNIMNTHLSVREAAAAMCLVTMATEPSCEVMAFTHQFIPLNISPDMRLQDVVRVTNRMDFGMTDCALPMKYASVKNLPVDTFVVYTDSETYYGGSRGGWRRRGADHMDTGHPTQELKSYRQKSGRDARSIVVGMTATDITIADPTDGGQLDVTGFDASAPKLIADFSAGRV